MTQRDERDVLALCTDPDDGECEVSEAALEQTFPLGALLRADVEHELERRTGAWEAFEAGVLRRIGHAEVADERMSLEGRAVATLKASIEAELADLGPRFERDFKSGVEARVWQAARARPGLWARLTGFFADLLLGRERGFPRSAVVAATALVALAALLLTGVLDLSLDGADEFALGEDSRVSVDGVSFEGNVTVMSEGGITVVWLTDSPT